MGCGGSKAKQKSDIAELDNGEEVTIDYKGGSEIKKRIHIIMALKTRLQRATYEKLGIEDYIEQSRNRLSNLSEQVQRTKLEYKRLLDQTMERDADDLYNALTSNTKDDKRVLIDVLTARTKWQLALITEAYERKYSVPLLKMIKENLRTSIGIFTGSNSELGRLLLLVATEQPERDAQLLTQHINDFDKIAEVLTTRSNRELKAALDYYHHLNGKTFLEVIQGKAYQNCAKLVKVILECKRDEGKVGFDQLMAKDIVMQLTDAMRHKKADDVIRILANLSFAQFDSLNTCFMNMNKKKTIIEALNVFSGDFYTLLVARCTERFHYLCARIAEDKDNITRVLGCLTRADCKILRDRFDLYKARYGNGFTLESVLRTEIKRESFLTACLNLVSSDTSSFPLGVDRELREDELLVENVVKGVEQAAKDAYDPEAMRERGEAVAKEKGIDIDMEKPRVPVTKGRAEATAALAELDDLIQELKTEMRQTEEAVTHITELSFAMAAHLRQAEEWTAMYETYANQLNGHNERLAEAAAAAAAQLDNSRHSLFGAPFGKLSTLRLPQI